MNSRIRPPKRVFIGYLLPTFILYLVVFIVPVFLAIYFSFFNFRSINYMTFIGLTNYKQLFQDVNMWQSLKNNFFLVFVCLIGQIGIAFLLANMLNSRLVGRRLGTFYRTVIYFPVTLSAVVIGYVWTMIYDYNYGLLNYVLQLLGHADAVKPWLADNSTVMLCVSIPMIWQYVGFHLVILLSALTAINPEVHEMAELDGASGFRKAISITFPMIKNTLMICVYLCISANMKAFDHIMAMTQGGPGHSSMVVSYYAYKVSFEQNNIGYGNTISVAIMVVTIVIFGLSRGVMNYLGRKSALE